MLSESDFASEPEFGSAHGHGSGGGRRHGPVEITAPLSDIASSDMDADVEVGSAQGTGGGSDGGNGHFNLEQAAGALSLASDDETTPRRLPLRGTAYRAWPNMWDNTPHQRARSGSSPSRSPARRKPRWPLGRTMVKKSAQDNSGGKTESFYDFLFN